MWRRPLKIQKSELKRDVLSVFYKVLRQCVLLIKLFVFEESGGEVNRLSPDGETLTAVWVQAEFVSSRLSRQLPPDRSTRHVFILRFHLGEFETELFTLSSNKYFYLPQNPFIKLDKRLVRGLSLSLCQRGRRFPQVEGLMEHQLHCAGVKRGRCWMM